MAAFEGEIDQVPPMYSALKHQGRPLYEYAREGVEIARPARHITIHSLTLVSFDGQQAVIDVVCSKGTYVRTLAEDIGERLDAGAHLTGLRRTRTAGFSLENAITLAELEALSVGERDNLLLPPDVLVGHLPEIILSDEQSSHFCHGQAVQIAENHAIMTRFRVYQQEARKFLGLAEMREASMDFDRADYLTGVGQKTFVAELMPKHPIYIDLLPETARAVIREPHPNTRPALSLLESEGFRCEGYVDIFDAGPTVQAYTHAWQGFIGTPYRWAAAG